MNESEFKGELVRAFILASSLEPFADKPGCTTRHTDSSPGTKLEYFLVSAVNSARPFQSLVERILSEKGQPNVVFDAAYRAQHESPRGRGGGKVNYAQILMLFPIAVAQCLLYLEGRWPCTLEELFDRLLHAMRMTTSHDVVYLQKLVDLSTALSEAHHNRLGTTRVQLYPKFEGGSVLDAVRAEGFSHTMMATELRDGFPVCRQIYRALVDCKEVGLIRKSEFVYREFLPKLQRPDITADCLTVAFYLLILENRNEILFP